MADRQEPEAVGPSRPPDAEALARLQERLERASETAERLIAEAAARAAAGAAPAAARAGQARAAEAADQAGATEPAEAADHAGAAGTSGQAGPGKPPPAGWRRAEDEAPPPQFEIEMLLEAIQALRDRIPPELQQRLGEAVREVLLALRALIDWYLERTERRRTEPVQAHDIPIV
jgi:hypothetical protein